MKFDELKVMIVADMKKAIAKKPDKAKYIATAYNRVIGGIKNLYKDSDKVSQAKILEIDLTPHMREKLIYFSSLPVSNAIKQEVKDNKLKEELKDLLGIGDKKAKDLINKGLTSVKQLQRPKWQQYLNADTLAHLQHDVKEHIPREEIEKFEHKLTQYNKHTVIIGGSYRRHRKFVNDLDILFLSNFPGDIDGYLKKIEERFDGNIWIYAKGKDKISIIIQPYSNKTFKFKADIFICNSTNFYSMLLYITGSKQFNISTRARAKRKGLLLNQNGIFDKNGKKLNKDTDDEKALLELIGTKYLPPSDRE